MSIACYDGIADRYEEMLGPTSPLTERAEGLAGAGSDRCLQLCFGAVHLPVERLLEEPPGGERGHPFWLALRARR